MATPNDSAALAFIKAKHPYLAFATANARPLLVAFIAVLIFVAALFGHEVLAGVESGLAAVIRALPKR